jgi:hypothetical protein
VFVVATYDGSTMRIYRDGHQVASTAKTGSLATSASVPVKIGRNGSSASNEFAGVMDEVRIYDRALSAGQVTALMTDTPPPPGSGTRIPFSDETLSEGVHMIRVVHITEARTRIDELRAGAGLTSASWSTIGAGTPIRTAHINELWAALSTLYARRGQALPRVTDPVLVPGVTPIKAAHIRELRAAIEALE